MVVPFKLMSVADDWIWRRSDRLGWKLFSLSFLQKIDFCDRFHLGKSSNSVDIEHEDEHWMTILNKRVSNPNRSWAFYTFIFLLSHSLEELHSAEFSNSSPDSPMPSWNVILAKVWSRQCKKSSGMHLGPRRGGMKDETKSALETGLDNHFHEPLTMKRSVN